ncbi:MAG: hypothetical protein KF678_13355 [Phycisphaeraceae bacterium]|nr:hypothetical protein [Phycisphaeraceae bacterium]
MKAMRKPLLVGVGLGLVAGLGGCHGFHAHYYGPGLHVDACGDGGWFLVGALAIAYGIHAIAEACRCR